MNKNFNIFNEDCINFMNKLEKQNGKCVDVILTSPPYNTERSKGDMTKYEKRYDVYTGMDKNEYIDWTIDVFNHYDSILKDNGCILYNMSYGNENPTQMYDAISGILGQTNFTIADTIIWKKKSALPNNMSHNKLTRICEFIFVLCRKNEYKTFFMNKSVKSKRKTGQNNYENIFNFIEAKNNDGLTKLNKATYSSELCEKLLKMYAKPNSLVYDSFNGTGTTGVAALRLGHKYIGTELSKKQCEFSINRLNDIENSII